MSSENLKQYQKYMTDNNFDIAITSYDLIWIIKISSSMSNIYMYMFLFWKPGSSAIMILIYSIINFLK